jgi:hypothetical protein
MELGGLQPPDFEAFVRTQLRRTSQALLGQMDAHLQTQASRPAYWADDARQYQAALRGALAREDYDVPLDLLQGRDPDQARRLARRLVLRFGQLLYWWPDMVQAARRLHVQGHTLASPVEPAPQRA